MISMTSQTSRQETPPWETPRAEKEPQGLMVTTDEAALYLFGKNDRTTIQRLYRMIDLKQIEAKKCGGTWWISKTVLAEFASDASGFADTGADS